MVKEYDANCSLSANVSPYLPTPGRVGTEIPPSSLRSGPRVLLMRHVVQSRAEELHRRGRGKYPNGNPESGIWCKFDR